MKHFPTRLGYTSRVLVGSLLTPVIELGTSFSIRNHKFSVGAEQTLACEELFKAAMALLRIGRY